MFPTLAPLLLVAAPFAPQDPGDGPAWGERTTEQLIAIVQRERDQVDRDLFVELARRADREAFEALVRASSLVVTEPALEGVFDAAARLSEASPEPELAGVARTWLADMAVGQSWAHQRPASRALASLGGQVEAELRRVLRENGDPRCLQLACGGLVPALELQGDPEALELLLAWYRAPISGPQERLVRALASFDQPWGVARLVEAVGERELPAPVRVAAVGALSGLEGEAAGAGLLEALRARDAAVQLAGIDAIAGRGDVGQRRALEKLARSRDDALRKAAFVALDGLRAGEQDWESALARAATGRDYALRLAAVELYARRPGPTALAALIARARDDSHLVRIAALRALAPRRAPETLTLLLERFEGDSLRVQAVAREVLVELTGLDHGPSAARWREWWQAEGARFVLPAAPDAEAFNALRERRRRENPTRAAFYGIPLGSDRVCFVLDTSGSMDRLTWSGQTRLAAAVGELLGALEGFPVGGRFNLVFFSGRARAWKAGLVEMDAGLLAQASKYARSQRSGGGTALHDGLLEALEDEQVDTVVVLSDGQPTEGELTDPSSILADIQHRNRLRGVVFHCVALNHASELLAGLAETTGGSYREVR